jgi:hypothetical protein
MKKSVIVLASLATLGVAVVLVDHLSRPDDNAISISDISTSTQQTEPHVQGLADLPRGEPRNITRGYNEYLNTDYKFSVFYPQDLQFDQRDEGKGAKSIIFEDANGEKGFQIFVVPYSDTTITTERFKDDEPSGVLQDPVNMLVDGVKATAFYGHVPDFGDTREVWFIRDGFLYEVATYKELEPWLSEIMSTWKFL